MSTSALAEAKHLVEETWRQSSRWEGNLLAAQGHLEGALRAEPDGVPLLTGLGAVLCDRGRYKEAARFLHKAILLGSKDRNTHFAMAIVVFNTKSHAEGTALFLSAAKLEPSPETWQAYFDPQAH
ncbi:MAG: tetratricopeptide repeat protein [Nitrospirota bacterium]